VIEPGAPDTPMPEALKDYFSACVALGLTPSEAQAGQLTAEIAKVSRRLRDSIEPVHVAPHEIWDSSHLWIRVVVETASGIAVADYRMNHDDPHQRRVLGEQCRYAFLADQAVFTFPEMPHRLL